jgi:aryl sulfotransferase
MTRSGWAAAATGLRAGTPVFVGGADTFLYKGSNGRWRDVLTIDELATFDRRSQELLPLDAIAWTTLGEVALGS